MSIAAGSQNRLEAAATMWWLRLADESRVGWRSSAESIVCHLLGAAMVIEDKDEMEDAYFLSVLLNERIYIHSLRALISIPDPYIQAS